MPGYTPIYSIPYAVSSDPGKAFPETSKKLAEKMEAVLRQTGKPPVGSDLLAIIARLNALEAGGGTPQPQPVVTRTAQYSTRSITQPNSTVIGAGTLTRIAAGTQNADFITAAASDSFTLQPGVYSVSWTCQMGGGNTTGRTFLEMVETAATSTVLVRTGLVPPEDKGTMAHPNLIVTKATSYKLQTYKNVDGSAAVTGVLTIQKTG